jgi:hypothetical protein
MKVLLALGLALGALVSFAVHGTKAQEQEKATSEQRLRGLGLSLVAHKRRYKRGDQLKLDVMLKNSREEDVYVFGMLDWGYSASLVLHVRDASGKEIEPVVVFDAQTYASPDDKDAFLRLRPNHLFGTTFFSPLKFLGLTRPGRFAIVAEYNSPFSTAEVDLKPFLGKESGPLKSNVVWIEVVR